ncbi:hypothetical protein QYE76_065778 [Lolium multiflorum]|uniref:Uncharacterized protein n=1 Tax=Lolium multiflorum TaxID=4521 RepID=A0AAD8W973_LOLMU|nr:hypothetical protein QYE76_065778 [Lolium multiflorum]
MPITPEVEVPPKATSSAPPNPKDVINLDDLPEEPNAESGKGESGMGASSSHPPPEQPDVTSTEAPAHDVEKKLLLSRATKSTLVVNIKVVHLDMVLDEVASVDQNTRKLHEDLRVLVLEQKAEIEGLQKSYAESQQAISILETRVKKHIGIHRERDQNERELEEKHAQEVSDLAEKLKKSNQRIKTLAAKNRTYETEAENIDKMIFPSLGFEWTKESTLSRMEAYEDVRNSIDDLFEACRGIAKSLNLKRAGTTLINRMTKLMRMVPELIKDWQASSSHGVASLTLATCKAHFPAMDFASVARGVF